MVFFIRHTQEGLPMPCNRKVAQEHKNNLFCLNFLFAAYIFIVKTIIKSKLGQELQ